MEIVIVGAGVAGLSTAVHLAEAGCTVTVIEAKEPGAGAPGLTSLNILNVNI